MAMIYLASGPRTSEGDLVDQRVRGEVCTNIEGSLIGTSQHVEDTSRKDVFNDGADAESRERSEGRGLVDEGVAKHGRGSPLLNGTEEGKVPSMM